MEMLVNSHFFSERLLGVKRSACKFSVFIAFMPTFVSKREGLLNINKKGFFLFMYVIQHCFICRPSDLTVLEDAGIEPRTVATLALTDRRSYHSARYQPLSARSHPQLG